MLEQKATKVTKRERAGSKDEEGQGINETKRNRTGRDGQTARAEARMRWFDREQNSENGRMNPPRIRWQEMRNLFSKLEFDQKYKTNWHLTTWTDCEKRTGLAR